MQLENSIVEKNIESFSIETVIDEITSPSDSENYYLENFISNLEKEKSNNIRLLTDKYQCEEIDNVLIETETSDNGGITAMSGFYYQLLITTKYIMEMLNGKWDRVVVDHHQDIIVYNHEKIRFIQVKTKKTENNNCAVSDTSAYKEWIPKLLNNQKMFNNSSLQLEFELISNCTFLKAPKVCKDFETFYKNTSFKNGNIDGDLYDRIDEKKEDFNLNSSEIEKGLKAFKVTKIDGEEIQNFLYIEIGKYFTDYFRANDEITNMIISFLFKKCYNPEKVSLQIINNDDLKELMMSIEKKIQKNAEQEIIDKSSDEMIGDFIDRLKGLFCKAPIYEELLVVIGEFEQELGGFFKSNESDSISTILNRYLKKEKYGTDFRISNIKKKSKEIKILFKVMLLVKFYFGGNLEIDTSSNRLLMLNSKESRFNLFGIEEDLFLDINQVIEDFKSIFQSLDLDEKLEIIRNPYFKIILSGSYDNEYELKNNYIEVDSNVKAKSSSLSTLEELESKNSDESIAYVKNKLYYIDAEDSKFNKILRKMKSYKELQDIKDNIDREFNL